MRNSILSNILLVPIIFFFGASSSASNAADVKPELNASFDALSKDLNQISEHALDVLNAGEMTVQKKMEAASLDLDAKVDDLETKLTNMTGESKDMIREMIQSLKEKNKETLEKAKSMLAAAKMEFEGQLDETMRALHGNIDELKNRSESMSGEAKEKLRRQLEELHEKNRKIIGKLEVLLSQSEQSWKEIKALVFQILQDLKDAFERGLDTSRLKKV